MSARLEIYGIIALDYRIIKVVKVGADKAKLREPGENEADFSCIVEEGSVSIVISQRSGSELNDVSGCFNAVRALIKKVEEHNQETACPGLGSLLDVKI